jgi:hypothetical protein
LKKYNSYYIINNKYCIMPRGKELYNVNCAYIDSKGVQCTRGYRPNEHKMCSFHRPKNTPIPYKPCANCGLPSRRADLCIRRGCGWNEYQAKYNKLTREKNKLKKQQVMEPLI